jgi:hypothetical protein
MVSGMSHDQLFKELLHSFFREFLELFFSDVAARLNFDTVQWLEQEFFTDFPEGDARRADTLAQVETIDGDPELVLFHMEAERLRRTEFRFRMWEYYALIRGRTRQPVFPIVVYLSPGTGGVVLETYSEGVFGTTFLTFQYWAVGLPDLSADDYRESENLVGVALSALMKPSSVGSVLQKWEAIRRILTSSLDESRKILLTNVVENYIPLSETEAEQYNQLVEQDNTREAEEMISVYEERGIVKGQRLALLRLLRQKFGLLPEAVEVRVRKMDTPELEVLIDRILTATTLEELGLTEQ